MNDRTVSLNGSLYDLQLLRYYAGHPGPPQSAAPPRTDLADDDDLPF